MQTYAYDPIDSFREHRNLPRIVVSPNFRCGIFGFLASGDLLYQNKGAKIDPYTAPGNFGLWDLRMALEWTYANIHLFGGDPSNISAGGDGLTTALQLHHDAFLPPGRQIFRRAFLFSGAIAVQPPTPDSERPKALFDQVCQLLSIDTNLPAEDKRRLLRGVSPGKLLEIVQSLEEPFSAVTDGAGGFVPSWFMQSVWTGELGRRLKARSVQVIIGDCSEERSFYEYQTSRRESTSSNGIDSYRSLAAKLSKHFPLEVAEALIPLVRAKSVDWGAMYYDIMADASCHAPVRGFAHCLFKGGMTSREVLRYHVAWRPRGLDEHVEARTGISHVLDVPIWWYNGWRAGFTSKDRGDVLAFARPFAMFLRGNAQAASNPRAIHSERDVRILTANGKTVVREDPLWRMKLEIWNIMGNAQLERTLKARRIGEKPTEKTNGQS